MVVNWRLPIATNRPSGSSHGLKALFNGSGCIKRLSVGHLSNVPLDFEDELHMYRVFFSLVPCVNMYR